MSVGARSGSSRGSLLKKGNVPLPNLSISGKRETKCESTGTKEIRREGKRGRGGRERYGRNRGRETGKPLLIEQQGIFSSGLNDNARNNRMKSSASNDLHTTNLGRVKKVDPEHTRRERDINSVTYESEWLSDDEADNEELQELLRDGFLSDLKPGKVVPLVLPETEQEQFLQLNRKGKSVKNCCESLDTDPLLPTKMKKDSQHLRAGYKFMEDVKKVQLSELNTFNTVLNPTVTSSRKAAAVLQKIHEDEEGSVVMLQLPSTLSAVKYSPQEDAPEKSKSEENTNTCSTVKHCLDGFANGSKIGKLLIRKGGRMELSFCGMPLDVTCGAATRYNESILLIDSEGQTTTSTIKNECGNEQSSCTGYMLGKIVDSFICSHNLSEALDGKREKQQRDIQKSHENKNQRDEGEDSEMKNLLSELRSIEKKEESWSKWAVEYSDSLKYDDS